MDFILQLLPERTLPRSLRYAISILIALVGLLLRAGLSEVTGPYGFILFIPGIMVSSVLFDRGSGFVNTATCLVGAAVLLWPDGPNAHHIAALVVFALIAALVVVISEGLRRALESKRDAEAAKDLMLQELNHRTKNTFAIATSMVMMQIRSQQDTGIRAELDRVATRLQAIFEAHAHLQPSSQRGLVEMRDYLSNLCHHVGDALRGSRPIAVVVNADPLQVQTETAVAIGLITNELVTNAIKYAFPDDREGRVLVVFCMPEPDLLELVVEDDGIGCPKDTTEGLGSRIMRLMVQQRDGTMTREPVTDGCRVVVRIPMEAGSRD